MRIIQKPIHVAYIDHSDEMGGAEYSLYHLIKDINRNDVHPHLIVPNNSPLNKRFNMDSKVTIFHIPLGSINPLKNPLNLFFFLREIRSLKQYFKSKVDIVHTNTYRASIYGLLAGKLAGKTTVWHVRDIHKSFFFRFIMPIFADKIVAISKAVSKQFPNNVIRKKVEIIYNGVDFSEYEPENIKGTLKQELQLSQESTLIGMVGRMTKWKGYHYLINALPKIVEHNPDVKVVFVGSSLFAKESYLSYLKKLVAKKRLENHVIFLGQRNDIPNVMKSLDIFVSFSDREPFGRVIIEALAMGTPVIVANSGGAPEIIENGNCGSVVEGEDAEALGLAVISMLERKEELNSLGLNGRRWVEAKFDSKRVGEKVSSTYSGFSITPH